VHAIHIMELGEKIAEKGGMKELSERLEES